MNAPFVKNVAQPNNRPVRNFTSFSASLRCMDNLLATAHRPRVLISSTVISDLSKKIAVGADEMLLNAINRMNVKSGTYIFLDQSFTKDFGQLELLLPTEDQQKPKLYFRGAITQLDVNTVNDKFNFSLDLTNAPNPPTINGGALEKISPNINRSVSIVSVDLHLVSYPDKTVLPGGSVANSMVVTRKGFGTGAQGLINLTGYNMSISFDRVESNGQAVRNLIELGVIELLGRHAKVPYAQCLNIEPTNERLENSKRKTFVATPKSISVLETQKMLFRLGYYSIQPSGQMNLPTHAALAKYQADKDLIATGDLNYDVYARLVQDLNGYPANGRARSAIRQNRKPQQKVIAPKTTGRHLTLHSQKSRYRVNDELVVMLKSNAPGYLYCFHQSGAGNITQILPTTPDTRLKITKNYTRFLPETNDGFMLKFENTGHAERIMCVLQNAGPKAASPFTGKFKRLKPLPVKRLEDIPSHFTNLGRLKDWVIISEVTIP